MEKKLIKAIPVEVLKEMEEIQILGGTGADDTHVYTVSECRVEHNTYCNGGYCIEGCGVKDPDPEQP